MDESNILETSPDNVNILASELVDQVDEQFSKSNQEGSSEISLMTQQHFNAVMLDIMHVNLFCSFLICGTLVGIAIFKRVK